jgi:host factor-I protein
VGCGIKEIGMENKPAQNIQDTFLNTARKERTNITIYLLSGVKLTGRIRSFDKYSLVLETGNQEQLIFKHAMSTIAMGRHAHAHTDHNHAERPAPVQASAPETSAAAAGAASTEA